MYLADVRRSSPSALEIARRGRGWAVMAGGLARAVLVAGALRRYLAMRHITRAKPGCAREIWVLCEDAPRGHGRRATLSRCAPRASCTVGVMLHV